MSFTGYEWFVAWRHLRDAGNRRWGAVLVALVLLGLAGISCLVATLMPQSALGLPTPAGRQLWVAAVALTAIGGVVLWLGLLFRLFSVFTSISIFGVFLGTHALVVVLSVMSGFENDLRQKILGTRAHAAIRVPRGSLQDHRRVLGVTRRDPDVVAAQAAIDSEVMILSPANHQVVLLRGVDPGQAARVTDLVRYLRAPCGGGKLAFLADPAPLAKSPGGESRPVLPGVLVGCELAKSLRLYVGDDVQLAAPRGGLGPMGPMPRARSFRVAGIFYSGMYEYDSKMAFVALGPAQRLLGLGDEVTAIEFKVRDPDRTDAALTRLRAALGPDLLVSDWREMNRGLFQALKLEKAAMFIVLGFIVLVASFSIVTNLIMVVLQKGREIAVLKAMGSTSGAVLRVFLIEGFYICAIGMVVGVSTGVGLCLLLARHGIALDPEVYYIAELPVVLDAGEVGVVALAALGISLAAAAYPSWLASRLRPADGLRHE